MIAISERAKAHIITGAIFAAAVFLYRFPPEIYNFYPRCPVFRYFHVECPGCGATRAISALLHGRLTEAVHFNALAVFLVPLLLFFFANSYISILRGKPFVWPQLPQPVIHTLLLAAFLFSIFRNAARLAL